jgi:hypothetical protein
MSVTGGIAVAGSSSICFAFLSDVGHDGPIDLVHCSPDGASLGQWQLPSTSRSGTVRGFVGVAVDATGRVLVADPNNNLIYVYSGNGSLPGKWTTRIADKTLECVGPQGGAVDLDGYVYVSFDGGCVAKLRLSGARRPSRGVELHSVRWES